MTRKTCDLPRHGRDGNQVWKQHHSVKPSGVNKASSLGFSPIVNVIVANINTTLGVKSSRFTIEVHLDSYSLTGAEDIGEEDVGEGDIDEEDIDVYSGYCLRFFHGSPDQKQQARRLSNDFTC